MTEPILQPEVLLFNGAKRKLTQEGIFRRNYNILKNKSWKVTPYSIKGQFVFKQNNQTHSICESWASLSVIKTTSNSGWGEGFISYYNSRSHPITEGHQSRNSSTAGNWRQELNQRPRKDVAPWFALCALLSPFSYPIQTTCLGVAPPIYSGPSHISHQSRNCIIDWSGSEIFSIQSPSSRMTQACVNLT